MTKITVQQDQFTLSEDYSTLHHDNEDYFPSVSEAVYDALWLLGCIYDREEIAEELLKGIDLMEYAEDGLNRKLARKRMYEA